MNTIFDNDDDESDEKAKKGKRKELGNAREVVMVGGEVLRELELRNGRKPIASSLFVVVDRSAITT